MLLIAACPSCPPSPTPTYTVGGTVSSLAGSGLVLQDNDGDDLAVTANGAFTFATPVPSGSSYSVVVKTQPASPAQTCVVTNGAGTVARSNITDVSVTCTTNTYSVGGTVSGLAGSGLVLQDNAGDDLAVTADGAFTFATPVPSGGSYSVSVKTQPASLPQTCVVANGAGTVASSNITDVSVTCTTDAYLLGGTVSGLAGSGLVLQDNAGDDLAVTADGAFTFGTPVANGLLVLGHREDAAELSHADLHRHERDRYHGCQPRHERLRRVYPVCTTPWEEPSPGSCWVRLVLASPNEPDLAVDAGSTTFTLATKLSAGTSYAVTVKTPATRRGVPPCRTAPGQSPMRTSPTSPCAALACGGWPRAAMRTAPGSRPTGPSGPGETTTTASSVTGPILSETPPSRSAPSFASVSAGSYHTVAVKTDWTLLASGYNFSGQLGDGTTTDRPTPGPGRLRLRLGRHG